MKMKEISLEESKKLLLEILIDIDKTLPMRLLVECQPFMLQKLNGLMSPDDRDICRAKIVREHLE